MKGKLRHFNDGLAVRALHKCGFSADYDIISSQLVYNHLTLKGGMVEDLYYWKNIWKNLTVFVWKFMGGGAIFVPKIINSMKKIIFALISATIMLVCGCGKDDSGNEPVICPTDTITWSSLVKAYPFLDGFPVFDGEVENWQYKELGRDMKTVTFFDYKCEESVAKTYYAKFVPAGFTKSDGSEIYRKTVGETIYVFTGSYSGGNFALSFSVDSK